jgi:hypothetical protein
MSPLPPMASVGGWGELDPEQRKVIKARLGERLSDAAAAQVSLLVVLFSRLGGGVLVPGPAWSYTSSPPRWMCMCVRV